MKYLKNNQFSKELLDAVKASALMYVKQSDKISATSKATASRIKSLVGLVCKEDQLSTLSSLGRILLIVNSHILSEQKKSLKNSAHYNFTRHIELRRLQRELIKKRRDLENPCA